MAAMDSLPFDVLLLDLRLPGAGGLEVLRQLPAERSSKVIVMSGYLDEQLTVDALRLGADEILEKPVRPVHLFQVLDELAGPRRAARSTVPELVGESAAIGSLRQQVQRLAPVHDLPVMVIGETGTGKEVVARALHDHSGRSGEFVAINCAAMPESLFESELFGHAKGAFTGAIEAKAGLFERAADGTLFLDEVGELPPSLQTKLLRVLETRRYRRVGSTSERSFDARIVSATNRDLRGGPNEPLRSDLYFRLAGFRLDTTPLRARPEDIEPLVHHFLARFVESHPHAAEGISRQALYALATHHFPGNVRELRAMLLSALAKAAGRIEVRHVAPALTAAKRREPDPHPESAVERVAALMTSSDYGLPDLERMAIERVFAECNGNLTAAAKRLKIPRTTLRDRLKRYGIR